MLRLKRRAHVWSTCGRANVHWEVVLKTVTSVSVKFELWLCELKCVFFANIAHCVCSLHDSFSQPTDLCIYTRVEKENEKKTNKKIEIIAAAGIFLIVRNSILRVNSSVIRAAHDNIGSPFNILQTINLFTLHVNTRETCGNNFVALIEYNRIQSLNWLSWRTAGEIPFSLISC